MNCQDFAGMVNELAAQRLMDAVTRQRALRHAAACAACAARLAAENELTVRLRAFAEDSKNEQTPARVREALRATFAEHQRESIAPVVVPIRRPFIKPQWAALAAAAALVLCAVAVAVWLRNSTALRPELALEIPTIPKPVVHSDPMVPRANSLSYAPKQSDTPSTNKRSLAVRRSVPRPQQLQPAVATNTDEIATNYIPLTYTARADASQDGMVVRVEVARSTLLSMGLPLNAERSNELIKADVMMSGDGVPLAIRLVQR
jgi:hypothetical protein